MLRSEYRAISLRKIPIQHKHQHAYSRFLWNLYLIMPFYWIEIKEQNQQRKTQQSVHEQLNKQKKDVFQPNPAIIS